MLCWMLVFLLPLRFPPGESIADMMASFCSYHTPIIQSWLDASSNQLYVSTGKTSPATLFPISKERIREGSSLVSGVFVYISVVVVAVFLRIKKYMRHWTKNCERKTSYNHYRLPWISYYIADECTQCVPIFGFYYVRPVVENGEDQTFLSLDYTSGISDIPLITSCDLSCFNNAYQEESDP